VVHSPVETAIVSGAPLAPGLGVATENVSPDFTLADTRGTRGRLSACRTRQALSGSRLRTRLPEVTGDGLTRLAVKPLRFGFDAVHVIRTPTGLDSLPHIGERRSRRRPLPDAGYGLYGEWPLRAPGRSGLPSSPGVYLKEHRAQCEKT
jgi:hypothetical protein